MVAGGLIHNAATVCRNTLKYCTFLPFLYCTPTITRAYSNNPFTPRPSRQQAGDDKLSRQPPWRRQDDVRKRSGDQPWRGTELSNWPKGNYNQRPGYASRPKSDAASPRTSEDRKSTYPPRPQQKGVSIPCPWPRGDRRTRGSNAVYNGHRGHVDRQPRSDGFFSRTSNFRAKRPSPRPRDDDRSDFQISRQTPEPSSRGHNTHSERHRSERRPYSDDRNPVTEGVRARGRPPRSREDEDDEGEEYDSPQGSGLHDRPGHEDYEVQPKSDIEIDLGNKIVAREDETWAEKRARRQLAKEVGFKPGGWRQRELSKQSEGKVQEQSRSGRYSPAENESAPVAHPRPARTAYVPFERPSQDVKATEEESFSGTTITPGERKAFKSLFKLNQGREAKEGWHDPRDRKEREAQQAKRAKEEEDGEEPDGKIARNEKRVKPTKARRKAKREAERAAAELKARRAKLKRELPPPLRSMAEKVRVEAEQREQVQAQTTPQATDKEATEREKKQALALTQAAAREVAQVNALMADAPTDAQLWRILHTHVLDRLVALLPTLPNASKRSKRRWEKEPSTPAPQPIPARTKDAQLLPLALPMHLTNAFERLQHPSLRASPLPLSILPTLKRLGPAAYKMGTSPQLYNLHITALFARYLDLPAIVSTLEEMMPCAQTSASASGEVVDAGESVDAEAERKTLHFLSGVLQQAARARSGTRGEGLQAVWGTSAMREALWKLEMWRGRVEERLQARALREAREGTRDGAE